MISRRTLGVLAAVTLAVCLGLLCWRPEIIETDGGTRGRASSVSPTRVPAVESRGHAPVASPTPPVSADPDRSTLADTLNAPSQDIRADLRVVAQVLDVYRTNFPHAGNPTGNNAEITAVLTGDNIYHVAFIPRDHPAINAKGELCDRWGRPFFFHQLSGTRMEIRSAGPDQKFWTQDDAVLEP